MDIFAMHRRAVEVTYRGSCNIYEYQTVKNSETKISSKEQILVNENIPCKLSFENLSVAGTGNGAAQKAIVAKLFIAPEIEIKAGSKLEITQDGITQEYAKSGEPGRFPSHQEIMLNLCERWA